MFDRLRRLYIEGKLTKEGLKKAVRNGIITAEEYSVITGEEYE